jgi:hypothetical protein
MVEGKWNIHLPFPVSGERVRDRGWRIMNNTTNQLDCIKIMTVLMVIVKLTGHF